MSVVNHVPANSRSRVFSVVNNVLGSAILQARQNWGWLVAAGVCSVIVGGLAIAAPFASSLAVETVVACGCVVGGIAWIISAFKTRSWQGSVMRIVIGIVQLTVGVILSFNPIGGLVSLTMLVAAFFAADGTLRIVSAIQARSQIKGWGWVAASGVITVVFATIIALQLPTAALVLIGTLTGFNLLMSGFIQIAYGLTARRLSMANSPT